MHVLQAATDAIRDGRPCALATVIARLGSTPRESGARMLVYADGGIVGTVGGGAFEFAVIERAVRAIHAGAPERYSVHLTQDLGMCCGGRMEVFIEPLEIQTPLVVFGAGHVAHAACPLLVQLGFRVTVVDDRDDWLTADRFVGVERHVGDPRAFAAAMSDDPRAAVLIVTHDHPLDQDLIERLLPRDYAWIGMIGSRAKKARFRARLLASGMNEGTFDRLRSPVGLDIGAQTPTEIAVSIAAELIAHRRKRKD